MSKLVVIRHFGQSERKKSKRLGNAGVQVFYRGKTFSHHIQRALMSRRRARKATPSAPGRNKWHSLRWRQTAHSRRCGVNSCEAEGNRHPFFGNAKEAVAKRRGYRGIGLLLECECVLLGVVCGGMVCSGQIHLPGGVVTQKQLCEIVSKLPPNVAAEKAMRPRKRSC